MISYSLLFVEVVKFNGNSQASSKSKLQTALNPSLRSVVVSSVKNDLKHMCIADLFKSDQCFNCPYPPGGGVLGSIFAGYVPLAPPSPYPIIVYSVANYRPHVSHFWANIPQIPTCRNLLTPEIPQMCDPILVTLLVPIENATPL